MVFVILYMAGVSQWVCIGFGVIAASVLVWLSFNLNARYGGSFYTFIEQALCFFTEETNYRSSPSPFGIRMCDRVSGKPIHLDISDLPMKRA